MKSVNNKINEIVKKAFKVVFENRLAIEGYFDISEYIYTKSSVLIDYINNYSEFKIEDVNGLINFVVNNYSKISDVIDSEFIVKWYYCLLKSEHNKKSSEKTKDEFKTRISEYLDKDYNIYFKDNICHLLETKVNVISKLEDFIELINRVYSYDNKNLYFRGHCNINYFLLPGLYRSNKYFENEFKFINRVLHEKPEYFVDDNIILNKLAKMQHYGLPTRLLDVTKNPLVALYFACNETELKNSGEVIILNPNSDVIKYSNSDLVAILSALSNCEYIDKNEIEKLFNDRLDPIVNDKVFQKKECIQKLYHIISSEHYHFLNNIVPTDLFKCIFVNVIKNNNRIKAQEGSFILCGLNKNYSIRKCINDYRLNSNNAKEIFVIPNKYKKDILEHLTHIQITKDKLFPELETLCQELRDKNE